MLSLRVQWGFQSGYLGGGLCYYHEFCCGYYTYSRSHGEVTQNSVSQSCGCLAPGCLSFLEKGKNLGLGGFFLEILLTTSFQTGSLVGSWSGGYSSSVACRWREMDASCDTLGGHPTVRQPRVERPIFLFFYSQNGLPPWFLCQGAG